MTVDGAGITEAAATAEGAIAGREININDKGIIEKALDATNKLFKDATAALLAGPGGESARAIDLVGQSLAAMRDVQAQSLTAFNQVQRTEEGGRGAVLADTVGIYVVIGAAIVAAIFIFRK